MEERAELSGSPSCSSGHHYEDVSDKTIFIKSMLRTITNDEHYTSDKASRPSANFHDVQDDLKSDHSSNSNSIEAFVTDQNPSNAQSDNDGMHTKPAPIEPCEKKTPVSKPLTKEPQRVVKKILISNPDLKAAHRIVMQIMSDRANYAFMDEVDVEALNLWDYHDRIKEPMWLTKIEDKFNNEDYSNITQVIRDLRLMLENCYRYNGLDHYVSKQAMKIEQVLETKLSLLPRLLQVQTTLYVTSDGKYGEPPVTATTSLTGRRRAGGRLHSGGATTPLSNCLQCEVLLAQAEGKKRQQQERQEELLQYRKELDEWERDLLQQPNQDHLNAMWEIPAIGQFLLLFQETLALNEISYYELERCFLMPQESKLLAQVFTCLLSSPTQRKREISKNMGMAMPYKVWQRKLKEKVQKWYQVVDSWQDTQWAASDLGIDVHFFEVMGDTFPFNDYQYHELTYYQRVMLMKAVCDNGLEMQLTLRQCLDVQPIIDQRAIVLGEDSNGNTYVHFPQFCGYDLRIFKQAPFPEPELRYIEVDEPDEPVKMDSESEECFTSNGKQNKDEDKDVEPTPEPRKRPSNLRQKLTPTINSLVHGERRCTRTSKSSQKLSTTCGQSTVANSNHLNNLSDSKSQSDNLKLSSEDNHIKNKENTGQENCVKMGSKLEVSDLSSREGSTDIPADHVASKSNINKEDKNHNNSNSVQPSDCLTQDLKCDDKPAIKKMMENEKLNGQIDIKTENTNLKEPKTPAKESSKFDMKVKEENYVKDSDVIGKGHEKEGTINKESKMEDWMRDEKVKSSENEKEEHGLEDIETNSKEDDVKPKLKLPEVEPNRAAFTLVCDSIDSLKSLVAEFAERESVEVTKGRRKKIIKPQPRTESEVELHETLTRLLIELAPHESKLCNAVVRVKERLRKEFNNFQDSQDESDSWESESSSGSSSTSDSDSSESDDEEEENKNEEEVKPKEVEQEEEPVDEEEAMETIEPFLGISTRAQKISKKRKLIEAKKKAKLGGNEDHTEAKKKCLSPVNTSSIPILDSFPVGNLAASQRSLTPVNMDKIYQTLQQQIATACSQTQGNHSMNLTKSIPEKSQSEKNLVKTKLAAPPACTIVVDDAIWKEIQNDPQRQKEVVLKYLLQQRQKLSTQRDQKLRTTHSSQEIKHDAIGDANKLPSVTAPIPKSGLLSIPPEAFGVLPVSKQPTHGQPPVLLSQTAIDSQEQLRQTKKTQGLQTMSRETQITGVGAQKKILLSNLSADRNIPTLCSTPSSPTVSIGHNIAHSSQVTSAGSIYTPSKDNLQLTEAQIKENKVNEEKKQKENMLAQQWLQQLTLLQQATSKAPTLSKPQVQFSQSNIKPITKISTMANMKPPSGVKTNLQPLLSSQLISQAAKLLQKKPNSNSSGYVELVKKIQQLPNESKGAVLIPNAIGTSIPSTGVKTIGAGSLLKIQNHATSTSNTNKANQEVVVSLEYLQKLQQQAKLKHSNATLINQQVNATPQNSIQRNLIVLKTSGSPGSGDATSSTEKAVTFTNSQSSISPTAIKLPTNVANPQIVHQQIVATNQGKICLVKMADGTLRALNLVQQKAPVKKNILTSSLLSNQGTPIPLNTPTSQAAISMVSKPQLNGSTLMTQKPPAVTNNPSVKTTPSVVLPSPSPVHATKATTLSRNTTSQSVQNTSATNIIPSGEEYKTYMHLGVSPSRYNNKQNQSQTAECTVSHQSFEKHNEIVNTSGNVDSTSTLKDNYQDVCGSSTSITSCANIVVSELLVRNKATNEGAQNKFNQE